MKQVEKEVWVSECVYECVREGVGERAETYQKERTPKFSKKLFWPRKLPHARSNNNFITVQEVHD